MHSLKLNTHDDFCMFSLCIFHNYFWSRINTGLFFIKINCPIFLNADIFRANEFTSQVKFDPKTFLEQTRLYFPSATLSIGWTTTNNPKLAYTWCNVFAVFSFLQGLQLLDQKTKITFPMRTSWSLSSIHKMISLQRLTNCTFTMWSYDSDQPESLAALLLFRKFISDKASVFYDLGPVQDEYLSRVISNKTMSIEEFLANNSQEKLIQYYLSHEKFEAERWNTIKLNSNSRVHDSILVNNGSGFTCEKEVTERGIRVEGKFELFLLGECSGKVGRSRISLGNLHLYLATDGLVQVFVADKIRVEARIVAMNSTLLATAMFEYSMSSSGEVEVKSFDYLNLLDSVKLRVEDDFLDLENKKLVRIENSLLNDDYGMGLDFVKFF